MESPKYPTMIDYSETPLTIILPPEYADLKPQVDKLINVRSEVKFTVSGTTTAFMSAIRRSCSSEMIVYALDVDHTNIITNDKFIISEAIAQRVGLMPVKQTIANSKIKVHSLEYVNDTSDIMVVRSSKFSDGLAGFVNPTFNVCHLRPGKSLRINGITVTRGNVKKNAKYCVCSGFACVPQDQQPLNSFMQKDISAPSHYDCEGIQAGVSNPTIFAVKFMNHGLMPAKDIIIAGIDSLRARAENISGQLHNFQRTDQTHTLLLIGETDTFGCLITKIMIDTLGQFCTYSVPSDDSSITLRVQSEEPRADVKRALDIILAQLDSFRRQFE